MKAKDKFKRMYDESVKASHYQRDMPEDNAIVWAFNKIHRRCAYVRE